MEDFAANHAIFQPLLAMKSVVPELLCALVIGLLRALGIGAYLWEDPYKYDITNPKKIEKSFITIFY